MRCDRQSREIGARGRQFADSRLLACNRPPIERIGSLRDCGRLEAMRCEELLAALNDYVDGDLDPAVCEAFQKHLADCNPCQIVIDNIRQTITLYKAGQAVPLPAELEQQLHQVLRQRWQSRFPAAGSL